MEELQPGLLEAKSLKNGKTPVPCYGYMASVSVSPVSFSAVDNILYFSWLRKKCAVVRAVFTVSNFCILISYY